MKISNKLAIFFIDIISIIAIGILGYLSIVSINSTVYVSEYEQIFFVTDNPIVHLICIFVVTTVIAVIRIFVKKRVDANRKDNKNIFVIPLMALYFLILAFLCHRLRLLPIFDQSKVFNIAASMANHDFSDFLKGGYADKWTNQWGYLIVLMWIYRLFGIKNIIAIEIINIISILGTVYIYYKFSARFMKMNGVYALAGFVMFIPMYSYLTFVYGNIPSHFFCALSLWFAACFIQNNRFGDGLAMIICLQIAIILKTTALVFMLAILAYVFISLFEENIRIKAVTIRCMAIALCVFAFVLTGKITNAYIDKLTGMNLGKGVPRVGHIAMAMHEDDGKGAGWYNGLNEEIYLQNNCDYDLAYNAAVDDIKSSLANFKSNLPSAVGFFTRKINSMWIEPTHESMFILLNRNIFSRGAATDVNKLTVSRVGMWYIEVCNILQTLLYFGSLLYFINLFALSIREKEIKKGYYNYLFSGIFFIGSFLFYIMWEANSQYSIFACFMLIPYAIKGFDAAAKSQECLIHRVLDKGKLIEHNKDTIPFSLLLQAIVCAFVLIIVVSSRLLPDDNALARMFCPVWGTNNYSEYILEKKNSPIKESEYVTVDNTLYATRYDNNGRAAFKAGRYYIMPVSDSNKYLIESSGEAGNPIRIGNASEDRVILISNENGYIFRFQNSQLVMDVTSGSREPGAIVQNWGSNGDYSQYFKLVNIKDDIYKITYVNDLLLTYGSNNITVEHQNDSDNQLWRIIKAE